MRPTMFLDCDLGYFVPVKIELHVAETVWTSAEYTRGREGGVVIRDANISSQRISIFRKTTFADPRHERS